MWQTAKKEMTCFVNRFSSRSIYDYVCRVVVVVVVVVVAVVVVAAAGGGAGDRSDGNCRNRSNVL